MSRRPGESVCAPTIRKPDSAGGDFAPDPMSLDDRHDFDDLQRVINRLLIARLKDESQALSAAQPMEREQLERIAELNREIGRLRPLA